MIQELINDLHYINSMGETPDGDGITVNVQLWAERWITRLEADSTLRDAERYRWLRDHWHNLCTATGIDTHGNYCVTEIFVGPGEHAQFADGTLEAAIDAAMRG